MNIIKHQGQRIMLTGNKPYVILKVLIGINLIVWGKQDGYRRGDIAILAPSNKHIDELSRHLSSLGYKLERYNAWESEEMDKECITNPLSPSQEFMFVYVPELRVSLSPKQSLKKFLQELQEYVKASGKKIIYRTRDGKSNYIIA